MDEFITVLKNYAGFSGRAGRREYWMFFLIYVLIYTALAVLAGILPSALATIFSTLIVVFGLGLIIPSIAVGVRRLHDTDHSGWWMLISLIPLAGLYLLYFVDD